MVNRSLHGLGEALDCGQRGAELVGDVLEELTLDPGSVFDVGDVVQGEDDALSGGEVGGVAGVDAAAGLEFAGGRAA